MRKKDIVCQLLHNIYDIGLELEKRERIEDDGVISNIYRNDKLKRWAEIEFGDDKVIFRYGDNTKSREINIVVYYQEDEIYVSFNRIDKEPYAIFELNLTKEPKVINDASQEIDEEDYIDIVNNQMGVITGGDAKLEELNLIYRRYCYFSNDFKEYDKYEEEYREIQSLLNG